MKKYYLKIVFLLVLFAIPWNVNAACSYNERVRLQNLVHHVDFNYQYNETQYALTFDITVANLTNEIYMIDRSTGKRYDSNNQDFVISGYTPGQTIYFDFYAKNSECFTKSIFINHVVLPSYNGYYKDPLCKGKEYLKVCQKWLKHNMSYKEFRTSVLNFKDPVQEEKEAKKEEKEEIDWETVIAFWADYYLYILLAIIIIGILVMYFYDKKSDI